MFQIWLVARSDYLAAPLSMIHNERIGKENTGYVRHHTNRPGYDRKFARGDVKFAHGSFRR